MDRGAQNQLLIYPEEKRGTGSDTYSLFTFAESLAEQARMM